jgi:hypothetical protein
MEERNHAMHSLLCDCDHELTEEYQMASTDKSHQDENDHEFYKTIKGELYADAC